MKPIFAITMGDPAGIGPEIVVKALSHKEIYEMCIPVVIGDFEALSNAIRFCGSDLSLNEIADAGDAAGKHGMIDLIDLRFLTRNSWKYKEVSQICGKASFGYVRRGIELAMANAVDGVITGPICKESINKAGFHYNGHTEIFAQFTGTKEYGMLLMSGNLRIIHVTTHVPLRKACQLITCERVYSTIKLADKAAATLGIASPRIAVAGLNPHAGEEGLFGEEEKTAIIPAIDKAVVEGINVEGPLPPDTVFVKALSGIYDIVVAMYHDQGHIPVKLCGFKPGAEENSISSVGGVNCTIGLPIIRVSVDHGTAFDIAGEGRADEGSMLDAIKIGVAMAKTRHASMGG